MPSIYQLIYFVSVFLSLAIGLIVYVRRPKAVTVKAFGAFILTAVGWAVSLYLYYAVQDSASVIAFGRINYAFGELAALFFFIFAYYYPEVSPRFDRLKTIFSVSVITLSFITFATDLVDRNEIVVGSDRITDFGVLFPLFLVFFFSCLILAVSLLAYKYFKMSGLLRKQVGILAVSWSLGFAFVAMTNVILPVFFEDTGYQNFGPLPDFLQSDHGLCRRAAGIA
jgi:hypothetical protein